MGNVVDTGNVTTTGNVAWRRGTMTFSPIISAAGADPDSAALMMGEKVIVPRLQATLPVVVTLPVTTTFPAPYWSNHAAGPGRLPHARTRQTRNAITGSGRGRAR